MKNVAYSRQAIKTLRRMPLPDATRIREKVASYAADPASQANNVKRLQGSDGFRLRVGDWRVIFDENEVVIAVIKIGARGNVYKD